jgi:hypothetical protein
MERVKQKQQELDYPPLDPLGQLDPLDQLGRGGGGRNLKDGDAILVASLVLIMPKQ